MKIPAFGLVSVAAGLIALALGAERPATAQAEGALPDGPGKADLLGKCVQCHTMQNVVYKRRPAAEWAEVMDRMIVRGAQVSAEEQARILGYLNTHYGAAPAAAGAAPAPAGPTASLRNTLPAKTAELGEFLAMPATGNFAVRDARSQVARINFLVEEPGARRLFVGDSAGPLYVVDKAANKPVVYIDFNGSAGFKGLFPRFVAEGSFASGLLGMTFDPEYARNGKFYTIHIEDMTKPVPAALNGAAVPGLDAAAYRPTAGVPTPSGPAPLIREAVVVEWTDRNRRNAAFEGTAREILRVQLLNAVHPTNDLAFNPTARKGDPDWRVLYITTGDGGTGEQEDVRRLNPQRLDHFGGKIIRIVPDLRDHAATSVVSENGQYRIPKDNPFFAVPGARREIWATGLRNPHRLSWDGGTLLAFVIGSNNGAAGRRYETIDIVKRGANFGYPLREGPEYKLPSPVYGGVVPTDGTTALRVSDTVVLDQKVRLADSALAYQTTVEGNAISNGFVYRGAKWPSLRGAVVFGDIVSGRLFYAKMADLVAATDGDPKTLASFGEIRTDLPTLAVARAKARTPATPVVAPPPAPAPGTPPRPMRIDMRLAIDSAGEIYVLTKSDGVIRKVTRVD